jgi:hypothetical protein
MGKATHEGPAPAQILSPQKRNLEPSPSPSNPANAFEPNGPSDHYLQELGLDSFPNDLTRMLFLASLRDCNSGRYLHPQLSQEMGVEAADRLLSRCHDEVFRRLLQTPLAGYVNQLEEYIRYTRAERNVVLKAWHSLQAYRSTIPLIASPIYSEFFCLNVEFALAVMQRTLFPPPLGFQETASL